MSCMDYRGVDLEALNARIDVQNTKREYGTEVVFYMEAEADIRRDRYNSIKSRDYSAPKRYPIRANPIEYNPSEETLKKVGLAEDTEVMLYTAYKDWQDAGIDIGSIDLIRWKFSVDGHEYNLTQKKSANIFVGAALEILIGGKEEARTK